MLQEKVTPLDLVLVICTSVVALGVLVELVEGLLARVAHDIGIDVVGPARMIGENDDALGVDLSVSARDDDTDGASAILLAEVQTNDAVAERADLRRMARPHAELARHGDENDARDRPLEEEPVGTHELAGKVSHLALP